MASMAQTRAGSKALSNALRGIVSLHKSLSGTPAEEMEKGSINPAPSAPKPSSPKPQAPPKNKPKAPSAPVKPKLDEEAIEVNATEVKKPSLKEIIDSNEHVRLAVDELQAIETPVNRNTIVDKLLDLKELGKLTDDEYLQAKTSLE